MSIEAMKQWREALKELVPDPQCDFGPAYEGMKRRQKEALKSIDQAIAEAEKQEPLAYVHRNEYNEYRLEPTDNFKIEDLPVGVEVMLYRQPQPKRECDMGVMCIECPDAQPKKEWEGLSVFEVNELVENTEYEDYRTLVETTEAKLKEKNT